MKNTKLTGDQYAHMMVQESANLVMRNVRQGEVHDTDETTEDKFSESDPEETPLLRMTSMLRRLGIIKIMPCQWRTLRMQQ